MTRPPTVTLTTDELVERARALAGGRERRILGLTGAPGAGKSTVAAALAEALGPDVAALAPMDGFHLAHEELVRLGRDHRKGAPDTFDSHGFHHLLRRLAGQSADPADVVYAPLFDRDVGQSIGSALPVRGDVPLVIVEGNYLLLDSAPWADARSLFHEVWYLDPGEELRRERLLQRHVHHGKSPEAAREWTDGSDQQNAKVVQLSADRADLIIGLQ